jgi:acetyltransferase-like isoleucine patch superfamily enzyme
MRSILDEILDWVAWAILSLPGRTGLLARRGLARVLLGACGEKLELGQHSWINGWANVALGDRVGIGRSCSIEASSGRVSIGSGTGLNSGVCVAADFGEIVIGRDCLVGMNVVLRCSNHRFDRSPAVPIKAQGHESGRIAIGDDVWLGSGVTVLPGATIGSHSVIGAGAVVTGPIPPNSLAVGVPARVIRTLGSSPAAG